MVAAQAEQDYAIKYFILDHVSAHPDDITAYTAEHFAIKEASVKKIINSLLESNYLSLANGVATCYTLGQVREQTRVYMLSQAQAGEQIWQTDFASVLAQADLVTQEICRYAMLVLLQNACLFSKGKYVYCCMHYQPNEVLLIVRDDGCGLLHTLPHSDVMPPHLLFLELMKGQFSSQADNHSGNSLAICAQLFDEMVIDTEAYYFSRQPNSCLVQLAKQPQSGSTIRLLLRQPQVTPAVIIEQTKQKYAVVPVHVTQSKAQQTLSRIHAKQLLHRAEEFQHLKFDFLGVENVSLTFVQDIFCRFAGKYPQITLTYCHANAAIQDCIQAAMETR